MDLIKDLIASWKRFADKRPVMARALKVFGFPVCALFSLILWPVGTLLSLLFLSLFGLVCILLNVVLGPIAHYVAFGKVGELCDDFVHTVLRDYLQYGHIGKPKPKSRW